MMLLSPAANAQPGSLASWGNNSDNKVSFTPAGSTFVSAAAGGYHSVAIRSDGSLVSWGWNGNGQLSGTPAGTGFRAVAAGYFHSVAIRSDGSLVSWGSNVDNIVTLTPAGTGFDKVSAGGQHCVAVRSDGTLVSWGANSAGQVSGTPAGTGFVAVDAGRYHSVALRSDGSLASWGYNGYAQVSGTPTGTGFVKVSAGDYFSVALRADGSIVAWGFNNYMQVSGKPVGNDFVDVVAGGMFGVALRSSGSLVSWGYNGYGQVSGKPVGTGFVALAAGLSHAIALRATANAQWRVTNLHPAGADYSEAYGVDGGRQVGNVGLAGIERASLWTGTASSWVNLHPALATGRSAAFGLDATQQVGRAFVSRKTRASLWSGTSSSWVDLHPGSRVNSFATAVQGGQQVGAVYDVDQWDEQASLWSGTAGSWINLHPLNAWFSAAVGVYAGQQVGHAHVGGIYRASLWSGTPGSWVDLNPEGVIQSYATAVHTGQQVGHVFMDDSADPQPQGGLYRASLWRGTSASWVNLHPSAAGTHSFGWGVHGGQQVGSVDVDSLINGMMPHASIWTGTADSWVDLHASLPPEFTSSEARGIWHDGNGTAYVVGYGYNSLTDRNEALMWTAPQTNLGAPIVAINGGAEQVGGATIEFSNVTTEGQTTVTTSGTGPTVPAGFNLVPAGTFYDISTTAQFTGTIEICLGYNQAAVSDENNLKLMHYENGAWKNVTTSHDKVANIICGTVTSLSPFAIVETGPPLSWSGVLQPVNADNSSVFKAGSTIPVKFKLTAGSAAITNQSATLSFAKVTEGVTGEVNDAGTNVQGTLGNQFRFSEESGEYVFNWSTKGLGIGTYRLYIELGDGVERTVEVGLK
ncbi:MAG: PxKF domain-containing protein [Fimbriimonas sp.]